MSKKSKIIYIIGLLAFIAFLLSANNIIALLKHNNIRIMKNKLVDYTKDKVYYTMEISFNNDPYDSFFIRGWAFCETDVDNTEKEIEVILANDKFAYYHKIDLVSRNDVYGAFKDEYRVKNSNHGYMGSVSTVGMKNGIYNLYIYVKENDQNYGLAITNMMIKKDSRGISEFIWQSELINVPEPIKALNGRSNLELVEISASDSMKLKGWAFVEGHDTSNQSVFVRIASNTSAAYSTQTAYRKDVGEYFNNEMYSNSGFLAIIPVQKTLDEPIDLDVLVEVDGNIYLVDSYTYLNNTIKQKAKAIQNEACKEVDISINNIEPSERVKFSIDSCVAEKENGILNIRGWAFVADEDASKINTYIVVTSSDGKTKVYNTLKNTRRDVADYFNDQLYTESGFSASIPLDAITVGDNEITVLSGDSILLKAEYSYSFNFSAGE